MSNFNRYTHRLAAIRDRARRLPGSEDELGARIEAASPETSIERNPRTTARHVDTVNMATAYGERTDGRGSASYLVALAIRDSPEEATAAGLRTARGYDLPNHTVSMLEIDPKIAGLDPATRDSLSCAVGSEWFKDFGATPKRAILDRLGRTIVEAVGAAIRKPRATVRQRR